MKEHHNIGVEDFGMPSNYNHKNGDIFKQHLLDFINDPEVVVYYTHYKFMNQPVRVYFNPKRNIGVFVHPNNDILSGWKFKAKGKQIKDMKNGIFH
ncbi:MAG: hypothetical protein MPJ24_11850 [Pirellulaceae bacterium]|nr:hypothetical protein [Pirellulaceae bacterium]